MRSLREFNYIGQTKRNLKTKILEHQRAIRNQLPEKSVLCKHSMIHSTDLPGKKLKLLKRN